MDNEIRQNIGNITPPNWNSDVDKRYTEFFEKYYLKETNEYARKIFGDVNYPGVNGVITFRRGVDPHNLIRDFSLRNRSKLRENASGINLLKLDDVLVIHAHGSKKGNILFGQKTIVKPEKLVEFLEANNKISPDIKKIYTLNCYGGAQDSFISSGGRPVKSAHTSKQPIYGAPYKDANGIGSMLLSIEQAGDLNKDFKQLIKDNKAIIYDDSVFEGFAEWNKEKQKTLTSQEAWNRYVKDPSNIPDEFYISQGLDPKSQRERLSRLNIRKEPASVTDDIVKQETQRLAEFDKEIRKTLDDVEELRKAVSTEPLQAKTVTSDITERISKETLKQTKLSGKGKAAIGIAIAAGAIGAGSLLSNSHKEEKPKKQEMPPMNMQTNQRLTPGIEQQIAKDMSSYKYGKHITGFINF